MSLCNLVSRIMFKVLSWKQRESKLLSHSLHEKNLPACDYPHKTIPTQSSPVSSQPRKKTHMNCILWTAETTPTWVTISEESSPSELLILAANGPWQIPAASFGISAAESIPSPGWEDAAGLGSCAVEHAASKGWGQQLRDRLLKQLLASSCKISKVSLQRAQKVTWKI